MTCTALAPDAVVCSFVWNFAPIFEQIMTSVADGTVSSDDFYYEGGECAQLTDFADFVPEEVQTAVADLKAKIDSGEVQIYGGELKDNEGQCSGCRGRGYAGRGDHPAGVPGRKCYREAGNK